MTDENDSSGGGGWGGGGGGGGGGIGRSWGQHNFKQHQQHQQHRFNGHHHSHGNHSRFGGSGNGSFNGNGNNSKAKSLGQLLDMYTHREVLDSGKRVWRCGGKCKKPAVASKQLVSCAAPPFFVSLFLFSRLCVLVMN